MKCHVYNLQLTSEASDSVPPSQCGGGVFLLLEVILVIFEGPLQ